MAVNGWTTRPKDDICITLRNHAAPAASCQGKVAEADLKIDPAPAFLLSRCWCWLETPCMSTHTHITQIVARCSSWSCTLRRTQAAGLLFPRSDNHAGACPLPAFVVLASHPFLSPPTEVTARTFAFNGERRGTGFRGVTHTHTYTHDGEEYRTQTKGKSSGNNAWKYRSMYATNAARRVVCISSILYSVRAGKSYSR